MSSCKNMNGKEVLTNIEDTEKWINIFSNDIYERIMREQQQQQQEQQQQQQPQQQQQLLLRIPTKLIVYSTFYNKELKERKNLSTSTNFPKKITAKNIADAASIIYI